jgi:hypothetical protein
MDDRRKMRASDADRQEVIERLRTALDEGRLKMDEYIDRMGQAKTETARLKLQTSPARPGHAPAPQLSNRVRCGGLSTAGRSAEWMAEP